MFIRAYTEGFVKTRHWLYNFLTWCMNSQVLYFTVLVCLMEISRWSHKNILCSVPSKRTFISLHLLSHKVTFGGGQPSPIWSSFILVPILEKMGTSLPLWDPHHCNDYLEHLNSSVGCWCIWYSACLPMVEICLKNSSIISWLFILF